MDTLLVGFDSAWTAANRGAIVGTLRSPDGCFRSLGPPQKANFSEGTKIVLAWQCEYEVARTITFLDQPAIVRNAVGQRPVENIVGSAISRRYGGMQPANTGRTEMFGDNAPIWPFLEQCGGVANPLALEINGNQIFETYPVLTMIALGWTLADARPTGRLPKYNPERRKTFSVSDWQYVCARSLGAIREFAPDDVVCWLAGAAQLTSPRKSDQDKLDACLGLLAAIWLVEGRECLMVGDQHSGYIVVPHCTSVQQELELRCVSTGRVPPDWVRVISGRIPGRDIVDTVL